MLDETICVSWTRTARLRASARRLCASIVVGAGVFLGAGGLPAVYGDAITDAIEALADEVAGMNLQQGIENSLDAKLDALVKAWLSANDYNDGAACNKLEAFIHEVDAQRDKKMTGAQADALVYRASEIINILLCWDTEPVPPGMALIPAGEFTMGDTLDNSANAIPTLTMLSAFYMDTHEVSLSQWQSVYEYAIANGYGFTMAGSGKAADHPVQSVTWFDCVKWCNARSEKEGRRPVYYTDAAFTAVYRSGAMDPQVDWTAGGYRLPTEAEWEKAARGGLAGQRFPWGDRISHDLANYFGDTTNFDYDDGPDGSHPDYNDFPYPFTSPVGSFAPNGYGLYDMAGNVSEWCWDSPAPYAGGTDPHGTTRNSGRVLRGGDWLYRADRASCAYRTVYSATTNFRVIGFRAVLAKAQP